MFKYIRNIPFQQIMFQINILTGQNNKISFTLQFKDYIKMILKFANENLIFFNRFLQLSKFFKITTVP